MPQAGRGDPACLAGHANADRAACYHQGGFEISFACLALQRWILIWAHFLFEHLSHYGAWYTVNT